MVGRYGSDHNAGYLNCLNFFSCIQFSFSWCSEAWCPFHDSPSLQVEKLIGTFMSELGVSTQQLAEACAKSRNLRSEHEVVQHRTMQCFLHISRLVLVGRIISRQPAPGP